MSDTLNQLLQQMRHFIPSALTAIVVLIAGLIIAKFISGIIRKALHKIKIDKFGDKLNEIDFISNSNFTISLSTIISKFVYYFLMIIVLVVSTDILALPAISALILDLFNLMPKLLVGFVMLIFGTLLAELIRKLVETTLASLAIPSAKIVSNFLFYFLFINVVILAIAQAQINTAFLEQNISIIIGGGVFAFAIGYGLASKDVVANFLSSLYTKDKVKIGDIIEINGDKGQVIALDKTSVTIGSVDKKVIYPLKYLLNEKVSIFTTDKRLDT